MISCLTCLVSCVRLALELPRLLLWSLSCRVLIRCQSSVVHFFYIFETYHSVCSDWIIIFVMYFEMNLTWLLGDFYLSVDEMSDIIPLRCFREKNNMHVLDL